MPHKLSNLPLGTTDRMIEDHANAFSSRSNAKRAAEKAIKVGTAPTASYWLKPLGNGRFEIIWEDLDDTPAVDEAEAEVIRWPPPDPDEDGGGGENDGGEEEEALAALEPDEPAANPLPNGSLVIARRPAGWSPATVVEHLPYNGGVYWRVAYDDHKKPSSALLQEPDIKLVDADRHAALVGEKHQSASPVGLPKAAIPRKRREPDGAAAVESISAPAPIPAPATPIGRATGKSPELDAAAARGVMPEKPICTSPANKAQYQPRFDYLAQRAAEGDWKAVKAYEVKGINSYAKMVRQYRERLLAAHEAQQSASEAA